MKARSLWISTAVLALSWLALALILLQHHASWPIYAFVAISIILGSISLYLHHNSLPAKKIRDIDLLARQISARDTNRFDPLPTLEQPDEIRPIVEAFNAFLRLEKDRADQELAFSSEASHELRTPLTGMRLQAQIAQRTDDAQLRKKALDNILIAIDRSTHLVEQLLTLSRLTRPAQGAILKPVDICSICDAQIADYQVQAQANEITLTRGFDHAPQVFSNKEHLNTLVKNLLDNALNHTPPGGAIQINVSEPACETVGLVVEDSGPGIPPEHYNVALAPFQKANDRRKGGTGLGLAIARRIAELHNSTITLSPSSLGGLAVIIPFKKAP